MAFSPCPKCQNKETFDLLPISQNGFVVQATEKALASGAPKYMCATGKFNHSWNSLEQLTNELKKAGYGK